MSTELPSGYTFGKVIGQAIRAVGDQPEDLDFYPEAQPITGKKCVSFAPKVTQVVTPDNGVATMVMQDKIECDMNENGQLIRNGEDPGEIGVWLYTGVWTVSFTGVMNGIESFDILVTEFHAEDPLDLFANRATPIPPSDPVTTLVVPSGGATGDILTWDPEIGGLKWIARTAFPDADYVNQAELIRDETIVIASSIQAAAASALPEFDSAAGEYKPASVKEWIDRQRNGKVYGLSIPKGSSTNCTKTRDNTGIAIPTPGVIGTPAIDPYTDLGPFFTRTVNAFVSSDGVPHITAFSDDVTFSLTGSSDVWILAPTLYWRIKTDGENSVELLVTDTNRPGFSPQPKAILPDGTVRPYMLYAKYAMSIVDGVARSVSGQPIANRDVSHNSLITKTKTATTGYSGKSFADDWYIKVMFLLKYATKNSQSVFRGVSDWNIQTPITVAESGEARVIIATTQANNIPIGSALMYGSITTNADRSMATVYNVFDGRKVLDKSKWDASNTVLYVSGSEFNTSVGSYVSTAPWNTGSCDLVDGDGSPSSNSNGREPFNIQGIEMALGMNEILGDVILKSDGSSGWQIYVNQDSKNETTTANSNYNTSGKYIPSSTFDGITYPMYPDNALGLLFGTGSGASSSTGMSDITYYNSTNTSGERQWLSLGSLWNGSVAGLWYLIGLDWLSSSYWYFGSRLSAVGRSRG